jgi:benzil reductase ((S)-benzoin forming)
VGSLKSLDIISSINVNYVAPVLITNMLFNLEYSNINVLNISSGAATTPINSWSIYCSSKAANKMFFETLSLQINNDDRHSIAHIDPGVINTPMQEKIRAIPKDYFENVDKFIDLKYSDKLKDPDCVALNIITSFVK